MAVSLMFRQVACALLLALGLAACGKQSTTPTVIDDAYIVCAAFKGTNDVPECTVSSFGKTIDVRIDTNSDEARTICVGTAALAASHTTRFAGEGWTLNIYSPYSGDHPIATCPMF